MNRLFVCLNARLATFTAAFMLSYIVSGQCPTCSPDPDCISGDGFPAICPFISTPATAGTYYEETLTFFLPAQITDPGSGTEATLLSVTITSVTGLPYGLVFSLNDEDNTYHPIDGDNLGCATICGTPVLPGVYNANINVTANLIAFGFELTQSETFIYTIEVLPGEGSSNSFTYSNPAGCDQVSVEYNATIAFPQPTVVHYDWDFGNGLVSSGQTPETVLYDEPGSYTASLTTTVFEHVLNDLEIFSSNDNWNDLEDIISDADLYFTLTDASDNLVYTSESLTNDNTPAWTGLSLFLTNPPYSLSLYDADDISDDDFIASIVLNIGEGTSLIDDGENTNGTIDIALVQTSQVLDSAQIIVFPSPDATYTVNGNSISVPADDELTYQWYRNGVLIPNSDTPSITMIDGGLYYCEVTNSTGCTAQSSTYLFCPEISAEYDALAMELVVPSGFSNYQWFYNGLEIDGATTFYLPVTESGNYAVEIQTNYGCNILSEVFVLDLSDRQDVESDFGPRVFPVPFENELYISQTVWKSNKPTLRVFDLTGKMIVTLPLKNTEFNRVETNTLSTGVYILEIADSEQTYRTKVIKK